MTVDAALVQESLAHAGDVQLTRVVAMVDALQARGAADALLAPLRPRLAQLRPSRPPGFARLLFTPLDPVIVPHAEWLRSHTGLPRSALSVLAKSVRSALPEFCDGQGAGDDATEAGLRLWPAAAVLFDTLPAPSCWQEVTGLAGSDHAAIASAVAAVLHEAAAIESLARRRVMASDAEICPVLLRTGPRGPAALDMVVAVLLSRLADPARVIALATLVDGSNRAAGRATDRLAAGLSSSLGVSADVREAALEAARVATLLHALDDGATSDRRARVGDLRREADELCRRSFDRAFDHTLAQSRSLTTGCIDDEAIATMEASARNLRRLETAARKLGGAEFYDGRLAQAAAQMGAAGELGLTDRIRLVEILSGPEQALLLLPAAQGRDG